MVRQAAAGGSLIRREYRFEDADPQHRLDPFRGYSAMLPRGYFGFYPPLFPALSTAPYRLLGWAGLLILPLIAGILAAFAVYRCGRELDLPFGAAVLFMVGLGSPLLVYSTVFWDHSLQIACSASFAWLLARALRHGKPTCFLQAGLVLGSGVWLHETLLVLAVAVVAAGSLVAFRLVGYGSTTTLERTIR